MEFTVSSVTTNELEKTNKIIKTVELLPNVYTNPLLILHNLYRNNTLFRQIERKISQDEYDSVYRPFYYLNKNIIPISNNSNNMGLTLKRRSITHNQYNSLINLQTKINN